MPVAWLGALALLTTSVVAYKYTTPDGVDHYVGSAEDIPAPYRKQVRRIGLNGLPPTGALPQGVPPSTAATTPPQPAAKPELAPEPSPDVDEASATPRLKTRTVGLAVLACLAPVLLLVWVRRRRGALAEGAPDGGGEAPLGPTEVDRLWRRAVEQMGKGRFDDAAAIYTKLCEADPDNLNFRQRLGDAQRQGGHAHEAVATYTELADRHARAGQLLKAIAVNKAILAIDPSHRATQAMLAKLYAQKTAAATPAPIALPEPEPAEEIEPTSGPRDLPASEAVDPTRLRRLPPTPLFSDLDPLSFVEVLQRCSLRRFPAGARILEQGDPAQSFFVVGSGSVLVSRTQGVERIALAKLGEGAFFGEMALLGGGPRTASVVAESDAELLEFPAEVLGQIMAEYPTAREAVDKHLRSRLLANVLAISPLFRQFGADERRRLVDRFLEREVAAGQTAIEQGTPGDGLYVVMSGRFQIRRRQAAGEPLILAELREGDLFGEISLVTGSNTTADVVATGPGRLLQLPRQTFEELAASHPQIRELAVKLAGERTLRLEALPDGSAAGQAEVLV